MFVRMINAALLSVGGVNLLGRRLKKKNKYNQREPALYEH